MDIQLKRKDLLSVLRFITPITDSSTPILHNFVLEVPDEGEVATCSATDYEMTVQVDLGVETETGGTFCLHAKRLLDFCSTLGSEDLTLRSDDKMWVEVSSERSQLKLPSIERSLYPDLQQQEDESDGKSCAFSMDAAMLLDGIDKTLFATLVTETRKGLMGVNMRLLSADTVCFTATDGHRLAQVRHDVQEHSGESSMNVIVPRKALEELRRILVNQNKIAKIHCTERMLRLEMGSVKFSTLLVEASFPNVESVIPSKEDHEKVMRVVQSELAGAVKSVSRISEDRVKPVKLVLTDGNLRLESERAEHGNAQSEVSAQYTGEAFEIGFNAEYLQSVFDVMHNAQEAEIYFKEPLKPCLIRDPQQEGFLAVIMPLRLEW